MYRVCRTQTINFQLSTGLKAIVSEYETKDKNEYGYEAHRNNDDAALYSTTIKPIEMTIGNGYFAVFYPQDGHMPQLCIDEPRVVKKVVVKVQMNN